MFEIHHHYDQLAEHERLACDIAFSALAGVLRAESVLLAGDDRAERVIDAISRGIIESRP